MLFWEYKTPEPEPASHGQFARFLDFYRDLNQDQRLRFARISEQIPVDPYAGLVGVRDWLYHDFTLIRFFLLVGRMLLNLYAVSANFSQASALRLGQVKGVGAGALREGCGQEAQLHGQCVPIGEREGALIWTVVALEFVMVGCLFAVIAFFFGLFLAGFGPSLPVDFPLVYFILPQTMAKLSSMTFLQYVNGDRMNAVLWRGDPKVAFTMMQDSLASLRLCPRIPEDRLDASCALARGSKQSCVKTEAMWRLLAVLFYGCLICFSLLGLRVKAMFAYFAIAEPPVKWTLREAILLVGLVSQLAGICDVNRIELMRILCFKFGGSDSYWDWQDCFVCNEFFRFLARKVVVGKIGIGKKSERRNCILRFRGRLRAVAVLCTLYSDDIQTLILSQTREKKLREKAYDRQAALDQAFMGTGSKSFSSGVARYKERKTEVGRQVAASELERSKEWSSWLSSLQTLASEVLGAPLPPDTSYGDVVIASEVTDLIEDFQGYQDVLKKKSFGGSSPDLTDRLTAALHRCVHLVPHLPHAAAHGEVPEDDIATALGATAGSSNSEHSHHTTLEPLISMLESCVSKTEHFLTFGHHKEKLASVMPEPLLTASSQEGVGWSESSRSITHPTARLMAEVSSRMQLTLAAGAGAPLGGEEQQLLADNKHDIGIGSPPAEEDVPLPTLCLPPTSADGHLPAVVPPPSRANSAADLERGLLEESLGRVAEVGMGDLNEPIELS